MSASDRGDDAPGRAVASRRPRLPTTLHRRARLDELLSTTSPLTIVAAPAGTGKTTAVAAWADHLDAPVIWFDAQPLDHGGPEFWQAVAEALDARVDTDRALPLGDLSVRLAEHLESTLVDDVVLVVDDYHTVASPDLDATISLFLRNQPPRLRMVIVSRHLPDLPLDRLRVSGDLSLIGADELRFDQQEACSLVRALQPSISPALAEQVVRAADGWAAALKLGAATATTAEPSFDDTGTIRIHGIDQYITHEVFGADEAMRDFLADLAVVDRFTAGLAAATTGCDDAADRLDRARARGAFVSDADAGGRSEIHPVVRRSLLTGLGQRDRERLCACRLRAAGWLERHDDLAGALDQFIRAGDHKSALRVLSEYHVELYDMGREDEVGRLLAELAPEATSADVAGLVDLAWCNVVVDISAFRRNVDHAVWWVEHGAEASPDLRRRIEMLRAIAMLFDGEWEAVESSLRSALRGLPSWHDDPILRAAWNNIARAVALDERWDDDSDVAREVTVHVRRDAPRAVVLEAIRALGHALAGRPVDALRIAAGVRASPILAKQSMSIRELALAEAIARRELGDVDGVDEQLEALTEDGLGALPYVRALALAELVQSHLDQGSIGDAGRALERLDRFVSSEVPGGGGRTWLGRLGTSVCLETGDVDRAREWADTVPDRFWGPVCRARVAAAVGASTDDLAGVVARSPRHAVVLDMLRATVTRDRDATVAASERAARTAVDHHLFRTLSGTAGQETIERVAWLLPDEWVDRLRRTAVVETPALVTPDALVEPLTLRERDVLRFLPSRLTLKEIADELYISVNTLKFHLKVIYRKLGVNSRAEAAEFARSWGRIEHR